MHLRRSAELTAQSILAGRREFLGDERAWLSARPRNYETIRDLPPVEQVCEQVCGLERDIAEDRRLIGEDRFFTTTYEDVCANPEAVLTQLADWYRHRAAGSLEARRVEIPPLEQRSARKVSVEDWEQISRCIEAMRNRPSSA